MKWFTPAGRALLLALLLAPSIAFGQVSNVVPPTWSAYMSLSAATSTTLTSGNVTVNTNAPIALPTVFTLIHFVNFGSNLAFICPWGGTCSATAGGIPLAAGAAVDVNMGNYKTAAPTLFSTSGTTLGIWGD